MISNVYWVTATLAVSPRPRGGDWLDGEVAAWRGLQIATVVSLLTADETAALDLTTESDQVHAAGLCFLSLPIPDRAVPSSSAHFWRLADRIGEEIRQGRKVLIHCRQGIGRASLLAAAVLLQTEEASDPERALDRVEEARGRPVPDTEAQRAWLVTHAGLNRGPDFDLT